MSVALIRSGDGFKLSFALTKDATGSVRGFTVTSTEQGEAEFFCSTFPLALEKRQGHVLIQGDSDRPGYIELSNGLCPFQPANVRFALDPADHVDVVLQAERHSGNVAFLFRPFSDPIRGFEVLFDF